MQSREIRLRSRPSGTPTLDNFELATVEVPAPSTGEVLVQNRWMSVDPYMRPRMLERDSYVEPFRLGQVLEGGAVGVVTTSCDPGLQAGDVVLSNLGWREDFTAPASALRKIDAALLPEEAYLGIAGMPGLTAYSGVNAVLQVRSGETIFVSAASGAVGSAACQFAKLRGAKVIGSAGGKEKCEFLKEIGVDQVIDYKAVEDFSLALQQAAPYGIDCCFDNVGGTQLDAAMQAAKPFARIALCGMISQYNKEGSMPGDFFNAIRKRLTLQGFIVSDHYGLRQEFVRLVSDGVARGQIKYKQTVRQGIGAAAEAFINLFAGENFGKMLVKLH